MLKLFLSLASIAASAVHLSIFVFWIFDWTKLTTEAGLIIWGTSIVSGLLIYALARKFMEPDKMGVFTKRLVLVSTLMTIALALLSVIIEIAVSSMP